MRGGNNLVRHILFLAKSKSMYMGCIDQVVPRFNYSRSSHVLGQNQSINQSILFLIKRYIINALSAVQWNTHISLNTYIYIYIYSEIQHTYKHSYKAAISAQIQCFYFIHTHSHTRGRCERPVPSLFLVHSLVTLCHIVLGCTTLCSILPCCVMLLSFFIS